MLIHDDGVLLVRTLIYMEDRCTDVTMEIEAAEDVAGD